MSRLSSHRAALSGAAKVGIVLQFLLSLGALAGGAGLAAMPDQGGPMRLSMSWLEGTPFPDYTIPGIVLFLGNGLLPLGAIYLILRRHPMAALATMGVGLWSIAWLVAEVFFIQEFIPLFHGGYGLLGLAIAACGYAEWRSRRGLRR
jgi:hypothetical protein